MDYNVGHATTQPVADDVRMRDPVTYTDRLETAASQVSGAGTTQLKKPVLSASEIDGFKAQGFLVKRGLVEDPTLFRQVVDYLWENVPDGVIRRDDPASWVDNPAEHWPEEANARVGRLIGDNWKMRSRGTAGIGTESFLVDRIVNRPEILALVEAMLGCAVKPATRARGIYAVLPKPKNSEARLHPHADYMAAELSSMVMVDEIPPGAGGFTVWPGSHLRLHLHWDTVHGATIDVSRYEGFRLERDAILREITPVQFSGSAGDVIFWHPRLLHSAGVNFSADWPTPCVRVIVPCDYQRAGKTYLDDLEFGPGPVYQWWVDTRNTAEDEPPTADNIWQDWGFQEKTDG